MAQAKAIREDKPRDHSVKVRVFISKKEKDRLISEQLKEELKIYGADRLEFCASEEIPAGEEWMEWIRKRLAECDILFLLFTGPSSKWDWPLYEAGLFTPISDRKPKPVICFHPALTDPPEPLKQVQAVPAEMEPMKAFLRSFYGNSEITGADPPLNRGLCQNDGKLHALAESICELFNLEDEETVNAAYYNRALKLTVLPEAITREKIPGNSEVVSDQSTLEIFGLQKQPPGGGHWTWGKLEEKMRENCGSEWADDLAESVFKACNGESLRPTRATLRSLTSEKTYRTNIHKSVTNNNESITLDILFIHQPTEKEEQTLPVKRLVGQSSLEAR